MILISLGFTVYEMMMMKDVFLEVSFKDRTHRSINRASVSNKFMDFFFLRIVRA